MQIGGRGVAVFGGRAGTRKQRPLERRGEHGEQQPAQQRAPEAERRAALCRLGVALRPSARDIMLEQPVPKVVHGVEREQHRRDQRDSGILDRVVQQTDEPRVGETVQQRDEDGRDRGHGERQHGLRHGHRLEQGGLIGLAGAFHGEGFLSGDHAQRKRSSTWGRAWDGIIQRKSAKSATN